MIELAMLPFFNHGQSSYYTESPVIDLDQRPLRIKFSGASCYLAKDKNHSSDKVFALGRSYSCLTFSAFNVLSGLRQLGDRILVESDGHLIIVANGQRTFNLP